MEQVALIGDVHGNLPALQAVLADIEDRNICRVIGMGDYVGKGPNCAETLDICKERCEAMVYGNWDKLVVHYAPIGGAYFKRQLGPERCAFLDALPEFLYYTVSGQSLKLFHGRMTVPRVIWQHGSDEELRLAVKAGRETQWTGFADTHHAFLRTVDGKTLFNTGAVGNCCDGITSASYAIVKGNWGSDKLGSLSVELVRVPYDIERAVALAKQDLYLPMQHAYIHEIRTGHYGRS